MDQRNHVIAMPKEGLAGTDLPSIDCFKDMEKDLNNIAYLGVAITYQSSSAASPGVTHREKVHSEGNLSHVEVAMDTDFAGQESCVKKVLGSCSSLNSDPSWDLLPVLSSTRICSSNNYTTAHLSEMTMSSFHIYSSFVNGNKVGYNRKLDIDSTCTEADDLSFATALSETPSSDRYLSAFSTTRSTVLEDDMDIRCSDSSEEFYEALENPLVDKAMQSVDLESLSENNQEVIGNNTTTCPNDEIYGLKLKLEDRSDLYSQKQSTVVRKPEKLNAALTKNEVNKLEKYELEILENIDGFVENEDAPVCTETAKSNPVVLDMRKYIIQKENTIYKKDGSKRWKIDSSESSPEVSHCTSGLGNSHLEASLSDVPRHPFESLLHKRNDIKSKAKRSIVSFFLCGCSVSKADSPELCHKRAKFRKKAKTRLSLGFTWKI